MPLRLLVAFAPLLLLTACAERADSPDAPDPLPPAEVEVADTPLSMRDGLDTGELVAVLTPTEGNDARGSVTFASVAGGVLVTAEVSGLSEGLHGLHVHETGDCSAPDASSAGGHYAPDGSPHGAPTDPAGQRHAGDLGNVEAGAGGVARYERIDPVVQLDGPASIVGKAVVVHSGQDDYTSQPSGDAGSRVACGVIEAPAVP